MTSTENAWHAGSRTNTHPVTEECSDEEDVADYEDYHEDNPRHHQQLQWKIKPLVKHKRPMRKLRMRKHTDEAIFSWKDAVLQRFSNVRRELMRFGYYNRTSYDDVMLVIEDSIAKAHVTKRKTPE